MAGVTKCNDGRRIIDIINVNGIRKKLRLGRVTDDTAMAVAGFLQRIVDSQKHGFPVPGECAAWLDGVSQKLKDRLVTIGVVTDKIRVTDTLPPVAKATGAKEPKSLSDAVKRWLRSESDNYVSLIADLLIEGRLKIPEFNAGAARLMGFHLIPDMKDIDVSK